jgi:uncharacterized membrane protein
MKVINPFQMNNWDIKDLFVFIFIIQVGLWITVGLNVIGMYIPVLCETLTFISLFFINGILILRILNIHNLGNIENLLYSVGLSLAVTMFLGMIIDLTYPFLGIHDPLSTLPLMITFTLFTLILCFICYHWNKTPTNFLNGLTEQTKINKSVYLDLDGLLNPMLVLCLIPFLAIFGTYSMNYYQSNIILIFMYCLIAIVPIMIAFDKFIPKKLYPLTVFSLSISLLFSSSLITSYLNGWDINMEYYFSNGVLMNSYWNFSVPQILNSMLSLVIIVPIFSKISGTSAVNIFKVIYPIIFSFVPVGLYSIFKGQTNSKIAFMGCFIFISVFMFFLEMPYLARQEIGELFVVLMIMLMVSKKINKKTLTILTIIFIPALLVSHYSLDYIYIFLLVCTFLIISLRNLNLSHKHPILERWKIIKFFFVKNNQEEILKLDYKLQLILIITLTFVYYYVFSSSALFDLTLFTVNNLVSTVYTYLFNPNSLATVGIVTSEKSLLRSIALDLHLLIEFMIGIGILLLLYRRTNMKFNENFSLFSVMAFLMLGLVVVVPFLAGALNPERFYQIALIFLSIFFVVGWIGIFRILNRILGYKWEKKTVYKNSLKLISIFLAISLIFNSGVIYEVFHDKPSSMSLSSSMDGPRFNNMEVAGASWLNGNKLEFNVYADLYRSLLLNGFFMDHLSLSNATPVAQPAYIYLGTINVNYNQFAIAAKGSNPVAYFNGTYTDANRIFDDGGSRVLSY